MRKGTRTVQAGSGSDSESRRQKEEMIPVNRLTQTVWAEPPEPATTIRTATVKDEAQTALFKDPVRTAQ